jgi:hypothetical protein
VKDTGQGVRTADLDRHVGFSEPWAVVAIENALAEIKAAERN